MYTTLARQRPSVGLQAVLSTLGLLTCTALVACGDDDGGDEAHTHSPTPDAATDSGQDQVPTDPDDPARVAAALWPMMGYDAQNHYHNPTEQTLGVDNASQLEVKWVFRVLGVPPGTPVIAEGKVFVLASGGMFAIDLATGQEVWSNRDLAGSASVAYDDGAVFVHAYLDAQLYKLDASTGAILWGPVTTFEYTRANGTSSPIIHNGRVYVGHTTALEEAPLVPEQAEARGGVAAFEVADGTEVWRYYTAELPENGAMVWSSVAVDNDAVYASTGNNYTIAGANSDALHAISVASGERLWASQVREGDVFVLTDPMLIGNPDVDFGANPILVELDGKAHVAAGDKAGDFWLLDRETGEITWRRENIGGMSTAATGGILNNGGFDGNAFYAISNRGRMGSVLVAMDPTDGSDLWPPKSYDKVSMGMPSTANGLLVAPIDSELHIFNAQTGQELKVLSTGGTIAAGAPAIAGGRIVVGSGVQYRYIPGATSNNEVICYGLPGAQGGSLEGGVQTRETPTWTGIWEDIIIGTGCNGGTSCHAGPTGDLLLIDKSDAYAALVNAPASGEVCAPENLTRVVPGDADASLLMQKLLGTQTCGAQMPPGRRLSDAQLSQVRTWIENGAAND